VLWNCNIGSNVLIRVDGSQTPTQRNYKRSFPPPRRPLQSIPIGSAARSSPANPPLATVKLLACNILTMPSMSVPNTGGRRQRRTVMRWWVYRKQYVAFVVQQRDPYYENCGTTIPDEHPKLCFV